MRATRPVADPSPATMATLATLQAAVSVGPFAQRVEMAKGAWDRKVGTKAGAQAFDEVKAQLRAACWGARRCNYCEDSIADEIEHFRPKDWYPDVAFAWPNYLYACGPCNGPKSNRFPIFPTAKSAAVLELTRARGAAVVAPTPGDPVLLDPRTENPADFLFLDIRGDLKFVPRPDLAPGSRAFVRASWTIAELHLNDRDDLIKARRTTLHALRAALAAAYLAKRAPHEVPPGTDPFDDARCAVERTPHRFVWDEMVRHRTVDPIYGALFAAVPEALAW